MEKIGIAHFQGRVAPVLDWTCEIIVLKKEHVPADADLSSIIEKVIDLRGQNIFERVRLIETSGIEKLFCGTLSPAFAGLLSRSGIKVMTGMGGNIENLVRALLGGNFNPAFFQIPGGFCCHRGKKYRNRSGAGKCPGRRGQVGPWGPRRHG